VADDPRNPGGATSSANPLTTTYGPLPAWGWLGMAAAIGFVWFYSRRKTSTEDTPPVTNTVTTPGADSADVQGQLATLYTQIRDLQGGQSTVDTAEPAPKNLTYNQLPAVKSQDLSQPHNTGPLKQGDSLESIALRLWADPNGARWLYDTNMEKIETAAKNAGYPNSQDGTILVPGINLWVPPALGKTPLERVSAS